MIFGVKLEENNNNNNNIFEPVMLDDLKNNNDDKNQKTNDLNNEKTNNRDEKNSTSTDYEHINSFSFSSQIDNEDHGMRQVENVLEDFRDLMEMNISLDKTNSQISQESQI